jgi:6-phosphogluconolactonase
MSKFFHIQAHPDALIQQFAAWLAGYVRQVLASQPRFALCLSGGNTPKALYQLLALPDMAALIDWEKVEIFWGDERFVPANDPRNNARMAHDNLLDHVPIPAAQVHAIPTENISPEQSAAAYAALLHRCFDDRIHSFDLVLLGLGDDAHTLSLFPGDAVAQASTDWATSLWQGSQQMHRVTLTPSVVNRAACVAFLVTGAAKIYAVQQTIHANTDTLRYPAQLIDNQGELHWWLTEDALSGEKLGVGVAKL